MGIMLLIVLIVLLLGALPMWPYTAGWGYYPGGGLGLILLIVGADLGADRSFVMITHRQPPEGGTPPGAGPVGASVRNK